MKTKETLAETITPYFLALMLFVCLMSFVSCSEEEVKPDCTPLKNEMDLAGQALFSVERQNPFNYGAEPTKAEVDAYNKIHDKFFYEYTLATKNYHDCKY